MVALGGLGFECNRLISSFIDYSDCAMSRVTNVILTAGVGLLDGSDPEIDSVNEFLRKVDERGGQFVEVSEKAGGTKHMECRVYLSAFNHVHTDMILRAIDQAPWRERDMVQVLVKEQEEDTFRLRYSDGSITG
jgi:hypothetical protein